MDGKKILDSMLYTRKHEFSDAIELCDGESIYFAFKKETLYIKPNPSKRSLNPLKLFKNENEMDSKLSGLMIDPIAYIVKIKADGVYKYHISPINKNSTDYVKKYKRTIMSEFKEIMLNEK